MKIKNKEIAERLGISVTAVSLAINNRPGVSEETRKKVLAILQENFDNALPKEEPAKPAQPQKTILFCVHKKTGDVINDKPFFVNMVETIQQEVLKYNYTLMVAHYIPGQDVNSYLDYIKSMRADGIILLGTEIDEEDLQIYLNLNIPVTLLDCTFDLAPLDSVALDNQTAIFRAFCYAYRMGHREIGFLKSTFRMNNFKHHLDGFWKGIHEFKLENENHPIIDLPCNLSGAYNAMKEFLANPPADFKMPTLFLADLDYMSLGAMQAMKEAGYRIPEDISFIGYDDVAACEFFEPTLTTSRVNKADIGPTAVQRLIYRMNHPDSAWVTSQISSELIIRNSVKDLRDTIK